MIDKRIVKVSLLIVYLVTILFAGTTIKGYGVASDIAVKTFVVNGTQKNVIPSVSEDGEVLYSCQDNKGTANDLYIFNMVTNETTRVTDKVGSEASNDIRKDYIVYDYKSRETRKRAAWKIVLRDRKTGEESIISDEKYLYHCFDPMIVGDLVVWREVGGGEKGNPLVGLSAYQISTKQFVNIRRIISISSIGSYTTDGKTIVWSELKGKQYDIYAYDFEKKAVFPVCTEKGSQVIPSVSGDTIVWLDYRNDPDAKPEDAKGDIYGFNLSTKKEFVVDNESEVDSSSPLAIQNKVFWTADTQIKHMDLSQANNPPAQYSIQAFVLKNHPKPYVANDKWVVWAANDGSFYCYSLTSQKTAFIQSVSRYNKLMLRGSFVVWSLLGNMQVGCAQLTEITE